MAALWAAVAAVLALIGAAILAVWKKGDRQDSLLESAEERAQIDLEREKSAQKEATKAARAQALHAATETQRRIEAEVQRDAPSDGNGAQHLATYLRQVDGADDRDRPSPASTTVAR